MQNEKIHKSGRYAAEFKELMNNRLDVFFLDDIESLGEVIVATCELLVKLKDVVHSTKDTRAR